VKKPTPKPIRERALSWTASDDGGSITVDRVMLFVGKKPKRKRSVPRKARKRARRK